MGFFLVGNQRRQVRFISLFLSLFLLLPPILCNGWVGLASSGAEAYEKDEGATSTADISSLSGIMQSVAQKYSGDYGMYLRVVDTGEEAGYQPDKMFYAASCYKLFLVMYIYETAASGGIDLDSPIVYGSGDHTNGTGIIQFMPVGTVFTTRQLCEYAIVYSDNIAARMLKRVYGYHSFRDYARSLGCPATGTYGLNQTTAREMGIILGRVLLFADVHPSGQEIIDFLRESIYKSRIPAGLPAGVAVGNKTGEYIGYLNDAALVFCDDAPYILCVLSGGAPGDHPHTEVSGLVYETISGHYCGGGHCTCGTTQPSTRWYFAEGTTRDGFETWLCLANPGEEAAEVNVTTMDQNAKTTRHTVMLPPGSRDSLLMNELVGPELDIAISATSGSPILAERPMYFRYKGAWSGGHCTCGTTQPSTRWYFAEGTTRDGFETWLCLANPGEEAAEVNVKCLLSGEAAARRTCLVPPHGRCSLLMNEELGEDHDVSLAISSNSPILAERPMYFRYAGGGSGGHCVNGAAAASREWYFAEGCSREGFDTWLCIGNPNPEAVKVSIVLLNEAAQEVRRDIYVAAASRLTLRVNDMVEGSHDISAVVTSRDEIVVERPVYFLFSPSYRPP